MFALRVAIVAVLVSTARSRVVPAADGLQELMEDNLRGSKVDLLLETTSGKKSGEDTPPAAVASELNPDYLRKQEKTRHKKSPTYSAPAIYQQPVYHPSLPTPGSYSTSAYQSSGAVYHPAAHPSTISHELPNAARCFKIQPSRFIVCQLPPSTDTSAYRGGVSEVVKHGHVLGEGNRSGPEGQESSYLQYPPSYPSPASSSIPTVPYPPRPFRPLNYDTANLALGLQVHPPFPQYPSPLLQLYVKPLQGAAQCGASQYTASASGVPTNIASAYEAAYSSGHLSSAYGDDNEGDAGGQSHHIHMHLTRTHLGHGHHHHHHQHNHHTRRSNSEGEVEEGPQKVIVPLPSVLSDGLASERDSSNSMVNNRFISENTIPVPYMT